MNQFTIGGAFSKGFGFFSGAAAQHALILIGMGVVTPLVLQVLLTGGAMGTSNPAMLGQAAFQGSLMITGIALLLVGVGSYVLQIGSYYASLRLGLDQTETTGGAIGFGLVTAFIMLVMIVVTIFLLGLAVVAAGRGSGVGAGVAMAFLVGIPFLLLLTALYTAIVSGMMVGIIFMLLIATAVGSSMPAFYPGASGFGGGAAVMLILLLIALLFFWVAVRFSCTIAVMAKRRSFNLFAAIAESWRLTGPAQWRIMGFLTLLGLVVCVGYLILFAIIGGSMLASARAGTMPTQSGTAQALAGLAVGIPVAYLTVLVPAGIYRELTPFVPEHEVFA